MFRWVMKPITEHLLILNGCMLILEFYNNFYSSILKLCFQTVWHKHTDAVGQGLRGPNAGMCICTVCIFLYIFVFLKLFFVFQNFCYFFIFKKKSNFKKSSSGKDVTPFYCMLSHTKILFFKTFHYLCISNLYSITNRNVKILLCLKIII